MTFETVTLTGTSTENFKEAVDDAISRAEADHDEVMWAEVAEFGVEVATAEDREYQAEVDVAYRLQD